MLSGLDVNTQYLVDVRLEIQYRECFTYMVGNYSDPIIAHTTNEGLSAQLDMHMQQHFYFLQLQHYARTFRFA